MVILPFTVKLTKYSIFSNTDMWCEENDQVATGRDVPSKSPEADLTSERDASKSTQVKGSFCKAAKALIQTIAIVINLVRTNTAGK